MWLIDEQIRSGVKYYTWRGRADAIKAVHAVFITGKVFTAPGSLTRGWRAYRLRDPMSRALPLRIDPLRLAEQQVVLRGALSLARMKRLGELLVAAGNVVDVSLRFGRNTDGLRVVAGELKTQFEMECQRCLQPFTQKIDHRFELALVQGEAEADRLLAEYEVLEVGEADIFTQDLVEDELLLSLPLFPAHADGSVCDAVTSDKQAVRAPVLASVNEDNTARNPFSALKDLKTS